MTGTIVANAPGPDHATLMTARLTLRPLSLADVDAMHALFSDADSMKFWSHPPLTDVEETRAIIERSLADEDGNRTWAVTVDGHECLGWVTIFGVRDRMGWVGYILSPKVRGQGLAREALEAALKYGFGAWNLHRLAANIDPRNHRSAGLLMRLGFAQEGHQRQDFFYAGTYIDTGVFGLLNSDWQARQANPPAPLPTLRHGPAVLRPLRSSDADALHVAFSDPDTMRYMPHGPYTDIEQTRDKIIGMASGARGGWHWAVTTDGGECLGWALLLKETEAQVSLGYMLNPAARGKGLARAATRAMLAYAFDVLGKNRVEAEIDPRNLASARVLETTGFTREGIRRQGYVRLHGEAVDNCLYGMLASEWRVLQQAEAAD